MKKKRVETFRNIRYGGGRRQAQQLWVPRPRWGSLRLAPIKSYDVISDFAAWHVHTRQVKILVQWSALWASGPLGVYAHAQFLSGCPGMVECLASYYCVSLVPRPIERVESIVVIISITLKSNRSLVCRL